MKVSGLLYAATKAPSVTISQVVASILPILMYFSTPIKKMRYPPTPICTAGTYVSREKRLKKVKLVPQTATRQNMTGIKRKRGSNMRTREYAPTTMPKETISTKIWATVKVTPSHLIVQPNSSTASGG